MFQEIYENDYSIAGVAQNLFHRWKASALASWSSQIPVLSAEEEQADEDKKTTREVEDEKRKNKKRDQQDDTPQPPQPRKSASHAFHA